MSYQRIEARDGLKITHLPPYALLSSFVLGVAAFFNASAGALSEKATYWRVPDHDAVFSLSLCKDRGICAHVHFLNAEEVKIRDLFAELMDKAVPLLKNDPPRIIKSEDIHSFCGFEPNMRTERKARHWHGSFITLVSEKKYTVNVTELSDRAIEVRLTYPYVPVLGKTMKLERVDTPPPACVAIKPLKDVLKLK